MIYTLLEMHCGCMTVPICIDYGWPLSCIRCGEPFEVVEGAEPEEYICE